MISTMVQISHLWPTKLGVYQVPEHDAASVAAQFLSTELEPLDFIAQSDQLRDVLTQTMQDYSLNGFNVSFKEAWLRRLDGSGVQTNLGLHCDSHYGGTHVLVFWLTGDPDMGGDLVLYDPAWRNPQVPADVKQLNAFTSTVQFKPGRIAIFPADVWHEVTSYRGNLRIGLNVIVSLTPKH